MVDKNPMAEKDIRTLLRDVENGVLDIYKRLNSQETQIKDLLSMAQVQNDLPGQFAGVVQGLENQMRSQNSALDARVVSLEASGPMLHAMVKGHEAALEQMKSEHTVALSEIRKDMGVHHSLQAEVIEIRKQLNMTMDVTKSHVSENQLSEALSSISELRSDLADCRMEHHSKFAVLHEFYERQSGVISYSDQAIADLRKELQLLRGEWQKDYTRQDEAHSATLNQMRRQLLEMQKETSQALQAMENRHLSSVTNKLEELQTQKESVSTSAPEITQQLGQIHQLEAALAQQRDDHSRRIDDLKSIIEEESSRKNKQASMMDAVLAEMQRTTSSATTSVSDISRLSVRLDAVENSCRSLAFTASSQPGNVDGRDSLKSEALAVILSRLENLELKNITTGSTSVLSTNEIPHLTKRVEALEQVNATGDARLLKLEKESDNPGKVQGGALGGALYSELLSEVDKRIGSYNSTLNNSISERVLRLEQVVNESTGQRLNNLERVINLEGEVKQLSIVISSITKQSILSTATNFSPMLSTTDKTSEDSSSHKDEVFDGDSCLPKMQRLLHHSKGGSPRTSQSDQNISKTPPLCANPVLSRMLSAQKVQSADISRMESVTRESVTKSETDEILPLSLKESLHGLVNAVQKTLSVPDKLSPGGSVGIPIGQNSKGSELARSLSPSRAQMSATSVEPSDAVKAQPIFLVQRSAGRPHSCDEQLVTSNSQGSPISPGPNIGQQRTSASADHSRISPSRQRSPGQPRSRLPGQSSLTTPKFMGGSTSLPPGDTADEKATIAGVTNSSQSRRTISGPVEDQSRRTISASVEDLNRRPISSSPEPQLVGSARAPPTVSDMGASSPQGNSYSIGGVRPGSISNTFRSLQASPLSAASRQSSAATQLLAKAPTSQSSSRLSPTGNRVQPPPINVRRAI